MAISRRTRAVTNALALALALVINGLAAGLPLNGMDPGQISDLFPNLFVPVGLTFSIWGLIYLGLLGLVGHGLASLRTETSAASPSALDRLGPWFTLSCLANAAWIVAWHWLAVGLSLVIMLLLLGTLLAMYLRLGIGQRPAPTSERWLVRAPISVYLGWITVATIANVTTLAVDLGVPAFGTGPAIATVTVMATAVGIAGAMLSTRRDILFALVVVWAFTGIYLKRTGAPEAGSGVVASAALAGIALLLIGVGGTAWRTVRGSAPA